MVYYDINVILSLNKDLFMAQLCGKKLLLSKIDSKIVIDPYAAIGT